MVLHGSYRAVHQILSVVFCTHFLEKLSLLVGHSELLWREFSRLRKHFLAVFLVRFLRLRGEVHLYRGGGVKPDENGAFGVDLMVDPKTILRRVVTVGQVEETWHVLLQVANVLVVGPELPVQFEVDVLVSFADLVFHGCCLLV